MTPLRLQITDTAEERINDSITWLESYSEESAQRFVEALEDALQSLCQQVAHDIARKVPLHTDELASIYYSRPVFMYLVQTGKTRKRRSSAGLWRLYYDITDRDQDGQPDTLRFLSIHHAAARPLWEEPRPEQDEQDDQ
jgi:plasmid stabilization system protein ParE